MLRPSVPALLLLLAAGCVDVPFEESSREGPSPYGPTTHARSVIESDYRGHLFDMEKGMGVEADEEASRGRILTATVKRYEKEARVSLFRVVVGVPPNESTAGYVRRVIYPRVMIFNRDTGRHEAVSFEFNYVHDPDLSPLPNGVIHGDGKTMLIGRQAGQEWFLGRFSLEAGSLILLHVCPCCGVPIPERLFLLLTRPDVNPERMGRFKDAMVSDHIRQVEGYIPVRELPEEFWRFPHRHSCSAAGEKEFGEDASVPVRLEQVKSRELMAKLEPPAEAPPAEKAPEAPAEGGEGAGGEKAAS
ncbi:MAG: hypothetical protein MUC63_03925 [Planctomycetes bacterium]|jgi:hypothetical protein|nr:hypothetical protein [Planctomycetota bacterium]